jgi:hypothetical protein
MAAMSLITENPRLCPGQNKDLETKKPDKIYVLGGSQIGQADSRLTTRKEGEKGEGRKERGEERACLQAQSSSRWLRQ